jgi:hypothetical protein
MSRSSDDRPTLFVGLDGPVLLPSKRPDALLEAAIAPYAKSFLFWATRRFRVLWLTTRPPSHAFHVAGALGLPGDAIAYAGFKCSRIEAVARAVRCGWVDGALAPQEAAWVQSQETVLYLAAPSGVTQHHKAVLERIL